MLLVHHLNDSRSQRVLWLLEELGVPYEVKFYYRDPVTHLGPPEQKAAHPLGGAPLLEENGRMIHESGAILDYILRHHAHGRLQPDRDSEAYDRFAQWMYYCEPAMVPRLLGLFIARLGEGGAPAMPAVQKMAAMHRKFLDDALAGKDWLVEEFTAADIAMSFPGELMVAYKLVEPTSNIARWVARFQARPAYKASIERGGPYELGKIK